MCPELQASACRLSSYRLTPAQTRSSVCVAAASVRRRNWRDTDPRRMQAPSLSVTGAVTRTSSANVPFLLERSWSVTAVSVTVSRAWRRDTPSAAMRRSAAGSGPRRMLADGIAADHVVAGQERRAVGVRRQPALRRRRGGDRRGCLGRLRHERIAEPMKRAHEHRVVNVVAERAADFGDQDGEAAIRHERVQARAAGGCRPWTSRRAAPATSMARRSNALGDRWIGQVPARQLARPGVEGECAERDAQQFKGILILS